VNDRAVDILMNAMGRPGPDTREMRLQKPDDRVAKFTLSYLDAFGYLKKELEAWSDITLEDIEEAVKAFQGFFGLKKTGQVDVKTVRAMEAPRCGMPDLARDHNVQFLRVRQFVNDNLPRWRKDKLTYAVSDYLPGISRTNFDAVMQQGFDAWTRHGNLNVARATAGRADIVISVGRGRATNFDGPGGTLAWAYLPNGNDGQLLMRFDLDETWTLDRTQRGIYLLAVATHEFGHLLGLDHSKRQKALMAPFYNPAVFDPQQDDDVPRFQARYGERTAPVPPPTPPGHRPTVRVTTDGDCSVEVNGNRVA
jgi:hypothetical protein